VEPLLPAADRSAQRDDRDCPVRERCRSLSDELVLQGERVAARRHREVGRRARLLETTLTMSMVVTIIRRDEGDGLICIHSSTVQREADRPTVAVPTAG
jgi:hypothetical protein